MTLLYIYLGSMAFFDATMLLCGKAIVTEIKNRGYKENEKQKNVAKSLINLIEFIGYSAIPLLNIAMPVVAIAKFDEYMELELEDYIKSGTYIKIEEEELTKEENIKEEDFKVISYNVNNELTNEQKIEFLKQELSRLTGKDITIKENRKGRQKRR